MKCIEISYPIFIAKNSKNALIESESKKMT